MDANAHGAEPDGLTLFTIGHSNVPVDTLIGLLRDNAIALLVDVRSTPYSQYTPQFNREALTATLREHGIDYAFAGAKLGGRPTDPTCYKRGTVPLGKANYLELVDYEAVAERPWYQEGIARLLQLAAERRTVIMCSEEDPEQCHRHHLIAHTLVGKDAQVWHIRGAGELDNAATLIERENAQRQQPRQLSLLDML